MPMSIPPRTMTTHPKTTSGGKAMAIRRRYLPSNSELWSTTAINMFWDIPTNTYCTSGYVQITARQEHFPSVKVGEQVQSTPSCGKRGAKPNQQTSGEPDPSSM